MGLEDIESQSSSSTNSDKNETESSSSGSGRMERIRPEKTPRQRVQKIWRNVRWAQSFPDESLSMESTDLTPNFALRKIALLFETKKYDECATLIRRMNFVTIGNILTEVPIEVLLDSMPSSLSILEAMYVKLYETSADGFPTEQLCMNLLLKRMVSCFARMSQPSNRAEKNCNSYYPSCRNILRVVLWVDPNVKHQMKQRKKALDSCLKHLGQHGLVDNSTGSLMNLHDALKVEFDKTVVQYRSAIQKLDELSLSAKHPHASSVTSGKAPSGASHHRLMQMTRTDVQSRIIKNKTLFNIVEPALTNQCLKKLIHILEKRIEYDKIALFHDTELRKFSDEISEEAYMSVILRQFSQGYSIVLQLLKEIAEQDDGTSEDDDSGMVSSDDEIVSPLTTVDRMRQYNSLTGIFPLTRGAGLRPSVISGPFPCKDPHVSNGYINGHVTPVQRSFSAVTNLPLTNGYHSQNGSSMASLEQEIKSLRSELQKNQDTIKALKDRESQLLARLSEQAQQKFNGNYQNHLEDLSLGENRPSELIKQYGNMYSEGRMEALDSLNSIPQLGELSVLKEKILFSVVVLSFRAAQQAVHELRGKVRHILQLPHPDVRSTAHDPTTQQVEQQIAQYLCKTARTFDLSQTIKEVCSQIYATLYDYPILKECNELRQYVGHCVQLAWSLSVQNPPYLIMYDARRFHDDMHTRFHTSDPNLEEIKNFVWPSLIESYGGACVYKGIVIT